MQVPIKVVVIENIRSKGVTTTKIFNTNEPTPISTYSPIKLDKVLTLHPPTPWRAATPPTPPCLPLLLPCEPLPPPVVSSAAPTPQQSLPAD